jgi:hypothetical protein
MIEVDLPDGRIVEFPDGTPQETMKSALVKFAGAPQPSAPKTDYRGDGLAGTRLGAAITGVAHGVTFGLADEAKAGLWDFFGRGDYDSNIEQNRNVLSQMREENPVATYGGEIAGSLVLPGAAAKSSLPVWKNALRLGAAGAAQGGAYGFGAGEGGFGPRVQSAAVSGAVGGAVGAAAPYAVQAATRALDKGATRKAIDVAADAAPDTAALSRQSTALFEKARASGVVVDRNAVQPLLADIAGLDRLDADFTPDALKVIGRLAEKLDAGDLPLGELEMLHRKAGLAVNKNRIANPSDAGAAGAIAQKVDEFMMNLPDSAIVAGKADKGEAIETFREARKLWKQYRNSERLQEIVAKAEISENPAGAIRSGFRAILTNKNKRATYSPAEIQVMRQVISESKAGGWVQRLIGYGTGLSRQVAAATAGYGLFGPIGAAVGSAAATKIGSVAKEAAGGAAMEAGGRAARFSATGGQYALPAPAQALTFGNALRHMPTPSAAGANWLTQ